MLLTNHTGGLAACGGSKILNWAASGREFILVPVSTGRTEAGKQV